MTRILSATVLALSAAFATTPVLAQGAAMEFVAEWDMNADGIVALSDFSQRRNDQFEMFDLNGDTSIDAEEQANMDFTVANAQDANHGGAQGGAHGGNGPGPRIHAAMNAAYADADQDGAISMVEWTAATQRLFSELDRNGDGTLDRADFGRNG